MSSEKIRSSEYYAQCTRGLHVAPSSKSAGRAGHHNALHNKQEKFRHGAARYSQAWAQIIEEYSSRALAFTEDRLPALPGLVRELEERWEDTYVAGTCRSVLVKHLRWYPDEDEDARPTRSLDSYTSPGWSCVACTSGRRTLIPKVEMEEAELLDVKIELVDENAPYGRVRHGQVSLQAPVQSYMEIDEGEFTLDFNLSKSLIQSRAKVLLLGYSYPVGGQIAIELVLWPVADVSLMRVGQYMSKWEGLVARWASDRGVKEAITII